MTFLRRFLRIKSPAEKVQVLPYFGTFTYRKHYEEFLADIDNPDRCIAELFLFRAWTTQFGFRLFSSLPDQSELIIGQVVNLAHYLGLGLLKKVEGVDVEALLGAEFFPLINERWHRLDSVVIDHKGQAPAIPTAALCDVVLGYCDIQDFIKHSHLCIDFLAQLDAIRQEAQRTGLFT